ncbi:hypothetical protein P4O66_012304, partial [Electrophorus voltai]
WYDKSTSGVRHNSDNSFSETDWSVNDTKLRSISSKGDEATRISSSEHRRTINHPFVIPSTPFCNTLVLHSSRRLHFPETFALTSPNRRQQSWDLQNAEEENQNRLVCSVQSKKRKRVAKNSYSRKDNTEASLLGRGTGFLMGCVSLPIASFRHPFTERLLLETCAFQRARTPNIPDFWSTEKQNSSAQLGTFIRLWLCLD